MSEKHVAVWQKALLAEGYQIGRAGADGDFGPATLSASMAALASAGEAEHDARPDRDLTDAVIDRPHGFIIPAIWMPDANMKRIIWHWTAGSYNASETDKEHYHMLVEGDEDVIKGEFSIKANERIMGEGTYAAHTLGTNTGSIGLSVCCMAGATESPYNPGKYPFKREQLLQLVNITAQLCARYKIPVGRTTTLSHAEVQPTLGIQQRGKWDYSRLPFEPSIVGAVAVGDYIRKLVAAELG